MDAETKAAMERVRLLVESDCPLSDVYAKYGPNILVDQGPAYIRDQDAVIRLALAEHPADDDELAPESKHVTSTNFVVEVLDNAIGLMLLVVNNRRVANNPTNRQVRRLVSALEGK